MINAVARGACPNCGNKQFVVHESTMNLYLTNRDGEIIDNKEIDYSAIGMCTRCNRKFPMMSTLYGFIPMTPLRKILFEYTPHNIVIEKDYDDTISNPMSK